MLILPQTSPAGKTSAKTAFLAPHFEEGRIRMLNIPSRDDKLNIITWEEHWNPYKTLLTSSLFSSDSNKEAATPTLMVDDEIRDFIVRGLDSAGFHTVGLSPGTELVRQQKSSAEIEVLRAVNTGTVSALRAMRPCLQPGLTETQVMNVLNNAMMAIGFSPFFNIVLFDEHGALPHGGFVTGDKKLTHNTMVVIDVGAHYLGYSSDICRSFLIDPPRKKRNGKLPAKDPFREEKAAVWRIVLEAQTAAAQAMKLNSTAASVDIAARTVIEHAGYGYSFTHRLGHGIGIKAHESPYLNKWNTKVRLQAGMTFTNEPGIYLENKFGVRHEDVYVVREDGEAELLTGRRARSMFDP